MLEKHDALVVQDLDVLNTADLLDHLQQGNEQVPTAVRKTLPILELVVDKYVATLQGPGRIIYIGAGTSGRLAALDAAECPPTFGTDPKKIFALIAGGNGSLTQAQEAAEDDGAAAIAQLAEVQCSDKDLLVGITASGSTPYVIAAMDRARQLGICTIGLTCAHHSVLENRVDLCITCPVGQEVLYGSTRLKAGTAQKMILNMLSTAAMIRLGNTYRGWMVSFHATNEKLKKRAIEMVRLIANVDKASAQAALEAHDYHVKETILGLKKGYSKEQAEQVLQTHNGNLRESLACGCGPQTDCRSLPTVNR